MASNKGSMPEWIGAMFAGVIALGTGAGIYAGLTTDIEHNQTEISNIKQELVINQRILEEARDSLQKLTTEVAVTKVEVDDLKKSREAAIRAIERMSASAEKLTTAIARLEERMRKEK